MFVNFSTEKSNIILQICMRVRRNIVYADRLIAVNCCHVSNNMSNNMPPNIYIYKDILCGEIIHIVSTASSLLM